jgi:hypothetical protein
MKKRTVDDIQEEIDDVELDILDLKKSIHEDEPDWREEQRKKTRDLAPGYIPLAERRKRISILERKIANLKNEQALLAAKTPPSSGKKFGYGELNKKVSELAKRDGFKVDDRVPSKTRAKWLREIESEGYTTSDGSIRAVLTNIFITKERPKKKED